MSAALPASSTPSVTSPQPRFRLRRRASRAACSLRPSIERGLSPLMSFWCQWRRQARVECSREARLPNCHFRSVQRRGIAEPRRSYCRFVKQSLWAQDRYRVRCEWGPAGAAHVVADSAVVVVDILSFTTSVSVAVDRGTAVYPVAWRDERATDLARAHGAALAVGRREVTEAAPGRSHRQLCRMHR